MKIKPTGVLSLFLQLCLALVIIIVAINGFVRVTPNDDGIIWFWLSQKFSDSSALHMKSNGQESPSWSEKERFEILGHMTFSMESSAEAEEVLRIKLESSQQFTGEDRQELIAKLNRAVSEASMVSDSALRKVHPELPEQFRTNYQAGLSAIARALGNGDKDEFARGAALYGEFKRWGTEHKVEFSYPPKYK